MQFKNWLLNETKSLNKKLLGTYGDYKVYQVNGQAVRNASPALEEFGGSNDHFYLSDIPRHEIWIEDDVPKHEIPILIASELFTVKLIEGGTSKNKAYDLAIQYEKDMRSCVEQSLKHPEKTNKPANKKVYVKEYGKIPSEGITVWLVHGDKVRDFYKSDFIEGGHGYIYSWIPNDEIWLEDGMHESEIPCILLHEFLERTLMKYKSMKYEKAHNQASKTEFTERRCKFTKQQALGLTKEKVLEMI
jgi:hypothetical protein